METVFYSFLYLQEFTKRTIFFSSVLANDDRVSGSYRTGKLLKHQIFKVHTTTYLISLLHELEILYS